MYLIRAAVLWLFSAVMAHGGCDGRLISGPVFAGPVCVPEAPQRIVVLDPLLSLGMLIELDVPVLAAPLIGVQDEGVKEAATAQRILDTGHPLQPSLERLLALKPDLIIGASYQHEGIYAAASRIAPTVLIDHIGWKDHLRLIAELSEREAQARELLAAYEERVQQIRARVPADQIVSVVRVAPEGFRVFLDGPAAYAPYAVLAEAGIRRTAYETTTDDEIVKRPDWEEIAALAGDVLLYVVVSGYDTVPDDALAERTLANPLWQMLPAVAAGRSHRVDRGTWMGFRGVSSAMAVLDDIERYLLK